MRVLKWHEDRSRIAWVAPIREILAAKPTDNAPLGGASKCAGRNGKVPKARRRKGIGGVMARVFKKGDLLRLKAILDSRRPS